MVDVAVFSHEEPCIADGEAILPEHIVAVGFRPDVAKKIARQAALYTSLSSHREAIVLAVLYVTRGQ